MNTEQDFECEDWKIIFVDKNGVVHESFYASHAEALKYLQIMKKFHDGSWEPDNNENDERAVAPFIRHVRK